MYHSGKIVARQELITILTHKAIHILVTLGGTQFAQYLSLCYVPI